MLRLKIYLRSDEHKRPFYWKEFKRALKMFNNGVLTTLLDNLLQYSVSWFVKNSCLAGTKLLKSFLNLDGKRSLAKPCWFPWALLFSRGLLTSFRSLYQLIFSRLFKTFYTWIKFPITRLSLNFRISHALTHPHK